MKPTFLGREPVLWSTFFRLFMIVLLLFGLPISEEQAAAVLLLMEAGLALLVNQATTATANVVEKVEGNAVVAGPANDIVPNQKFVRSINRSSLNQWLEGEGRHRDE